ncbi:MAG: OB-fold nucleic acid binding domain-containing protein [Candidatus Hadarchaeales archaeon]
MGLGFERVVEEIVRQTGVSREEVMARIREKEREFGSITTPEGLAKMVAAELGVRLPGEKIKPREITLKDLVPGMSNVNLLARVVRVYEPRSFPRWDGSVGRVASLILQDSTGRIRASLWDNKASLVETGAIQKGDLLRISGAYVQEGREGEPELKLAARSTVEVVKDPSLEAKFPLPEEDLVRISDLKEGHREVDLVGRVAAVGEVRVFERPDGSTDKFASFVLLDETGKIKVFLWGEKADLVKNLRRGEVVKLENAQVRVDPSGKPYLRVGSGGRVILSPDSPRASQLPEVDGKLLKLEEVEPGMPWVEVAARVRRKYPEREFKRQDGSVGKVVGMMLEDETGLMRVSFWDGAIERAGSLKVGDVVLLRGAYTRESPSGRPELHVSRSASVEVNPPGVEVGEFKPKRVRVGELEPGMDGVEVVGRVVEVEGVREFVREGRKGKVASLILGDTTGKVRVLLWQEHAERVPKVGEILLLRNAYTPLGSPQLELHLGRMGQLEINPPIEEELPPAEILSRLSQVPETRDIGEIQEPNLQVRVRGTIVQVIKRRPIFDLCPLCGRTLGTVDTSLFCEECGKVVSPEHRAVLNLLLDDGTGVIRAVLFGKVAEELVGMNSTRIFEEYRKSPNLIEFYRSLGLEGREVIFSGTTRRDEYLDQLELRVTSVEFPDAREEAERLLERVKALRS